MNWLNKSSQLDKYIRDVKDYLPRRLRKDISDELRANLGDRIADREQDLGREMTDDELIELLNQYGHPIRVAAGYHGATHGLISAELFPYYKLAIFAALAVAMLNIIVFAGLEIIYDITVGSSSWLWRFVNTFMYMVGCITAGFYITERVMERKKFLSRWKPTKSSRENPDTVSMWGAIFTIVALFTWLVILNTVAIEHSVAVLFGTTGNRFHTLLYWMKIQLVLLIVFHLVLVFLREKTRSSWFAHAGIELLLTVGCVICLLISSNSTRAIYADVPAPVLTGLDYSIWGLLVASLLTAAFYLRKGMKMRELGPSDTEPESEQVGIVEEILEKPESEPDVVPVNDEVETTTTATALDTEPDMETEVDFDSPQETAIAEVVESDPRQQFDIDEEAVQPEADSNVDNKDAEVDIDVDGDVKVDVDVDGDVDGDVKVDEKEKA